ncbi:MAG: hypothetical protein NXI27_16635 [Alphaproteobacteria bacterium]|nr:hypothetical protein [Alphaproteobacteria bacterium]
MRHPLVTGMMAAALAWVSPAMADENDWAGLYKGLDGLDGSIDYLSIAPSGQGTFDIRVMPSVISLCESGRGWIVAEGKLTDDGRLHRTNAQVICDGAEPVALEDRMLERDAQTGIVRYGASDDRRPLIFHRVSTP